MRYPTTTNALEHGNLYPLSNVIYTPTLVFQGAILTSFAFPW